MRNAPLLFRKSIVISLILFLTLLFCSIESGAQIKLAWDPNTEPDMAGYRVYYGTASRTYGTPIDVGNVTTYTLNGLSQRVVYYITVTAYNMANYESAYSNEVSGQITEAVSPLTVLQGPTSGTVGTSNTYSAGGSSSNLGHSVQYQFDWKGDGTDLSPWGSAAQSKTWTVAGTYSVRARARCAAHRGAVSSWSGSLSVTISAAAAPMKVTPSDGLVPSGNQGGPFSPTSKSYALQNTGGSSITWTASKGQAWTTLSSTSGTLAARASTTVTVSINSSTNSLAAGSYTDTVTFTNTTNGTGNTTRPISLSVATVSAPDLIVSTLTGPSTAAPGQVINLSEATKNQGRVATTVNTVTRFYLSIDSNYDASAVPLGERIVVSLAAGATSGPVSTSVTVPSAAVAGTYYIVAKADADNAVAEASENNNTYYRKLVVVGPDLTVLAVTAPASAGLGETITVGDTTRNSGVVATPASKTYFYLSSDYSLDAADTYLGSRDVPALAAGTSNTGTIPVTLPGSMALGTWYIIAKADGPEAGAEASETNNTYYKRFQVVGPDLIILTLTGPTTVKPGQMINLSEATRNQGSRATTVNTVTRFYLSIDSNYDASDVPLGERTVGPLAAGATSGPVSTLVTIPSTAVAGTCYIIVKADADNAVAEASDSNNTKYLTVRVSP